MQAIKIFFYSGLLLGGLCLVQGEDVNTCSEERGTLFLQFW